MVCDYMAVPRDPLPSRPESLVKWTDVVTRIVGRPYRKSTADEWAAVSHWLMRGMPTETPDEAEWRRILDESPEIMKGGPSAWYRDVPFMATDSPSFSFIDLFAGIGGFRIALQEAGGRCVFTSEWDASARGTYGSNFGEIPFGDIRQFSGDQIPLSEVDRLVPDHDVIAAGFPCQPFSSAGVSARNSVGKAHGFACDTQGTLFHDIMRIVDAKLEAGNPPKVLLLENVRNLQRHDSGRTFAVIEQSIRDRGFDFEWAILDSQFLVPQRRKRCYMVAVRSDLGADFEMPTIEGVAHPLAEALEPYTTAHERFRISDTLWSGHEARSARNAARGTGFTTGVADPRKPSNTLVARYFKDGKECLIEDVPGQNPRMLTPNECRRLQGYPEHFVLPSSKTAAYRQFGNSVTVPVVRRVVNELEAILNSSRTR